MVDMQLEVQSGGQAAPPAGRPVANSRPLGFACHQCTQPPCWPAPLQPTSIHSRASFTFSDTACREAQARA